MKTAMSGRWFLSAVLLLAFTPSAALPWGSAPTHPSIAATIVLRDIGNPILPADVTDLKRFVRATSCPDIVETQLFKVNGFGYVHSFEFADILRHVALSDPRYRTGRNLSTAYAWGVHIAADETGHSHYVPPDQPVHSLVEVAVDTMIYYFDSSSQDLPRALGFSRWEDTVPGGSDCSPSLVAAASAQYRKNVDPSARKIAAWQVWWATQSLGASIRAEYGYIRAKGNDNASRLFLLSLGLLGFTDPYEKSVIAAEEWIEKE